MSHGSGDNNDGPSAYLSLVIFLCALIGGTFCSLTSKVMLNMKSIGLSGEEEEFSYPLFQTFGMFLGMTGGLLMHMYVKAYKIPFPGYDHENTTPMPTWMLLVLIFPSIFDLFATILCMFGLKYVNVSVYQMLRGSAIVFVAILKQFVLGDKLKKFMWMGIFWNVVSIILVGLTAIMQEPNEDQEGEASNATLGVTLILCGAMVQSLQYAFEEKVMSMTSDSEMIPTPPLLLIGMEGFWGLLMCVFILYPIAYFTPGPDHGSLENPFNTYAQLSNSTDIQICFIIYFFSILSYNILAVLVTYLLSAVWHAILDNFRPITVWGVDLFIFYVITTSFGESWSYPWSWLQVAGMFVLLYGTAVYNAPNTGSIQLTGGLLNCFLDFSDEYEDIEDDKMAADYSLVNADRPSSAKSSPYYSNLSPFMSRPSTKSPKVQSTGGAYTEMAASANDGLLGGAKPRSYGADV